MTVDNCARATSLQGYKGRDVIVNTQVHLLFAGLTDTFRKRNLISLPIAADRSRQVPIGPVFAGMHPELSGVIRTWLGSYRGLVV